MMGKIFSLVKNHFNNDVQKTYDWFTSIHPIFGKKPIDVIREGRQAKLLKYVISQLDENQR